MINSPNQETALASELLEIASEAEIDRLLPMLIRPALKGLRPVAAMVLRAAAPVMKKAAAKAIPAIRSAGAGRRARASGDVGFDSAVSTRDARLWGTGFQRSRPREIQMAMSLRFIQAARRAARRAAIATLRQIQRGRPVTYEALRRVVYRALIGAVRERAPFLLPTVSAVSTSLRRAPGSTGSTLSQVRGGRIVGAPATPNLRRRPGYTGPVLPAPRSRILGELGDTRCTACQHQRVGAGA